MPIDVDATIRAAQQLLQDELALARTWLTIHQNDYDRAELNVRVGKGFDPGESTPDPYRRATIALSQRRIDCVAWSGGNPTIIELKDRIGLSALGQLLAYRGLFADTFPGNPPAKLIAVGWYKGPDIDAAFIQAGISIELVPVS